MGRERGKTRRARWCWWELLQPVWEVIGISECIALRITQLTCQMPSDETLRTAKKSTPLLATQQRALSLTAVFLLRLRTWVAAAITTAQMAHHCHVCHTLRLVTPSKLNQHWENLAIIITAGHTRVLHWHVWTRLTAAWNAPLCLCRTYQARCKHRRVSCFYVIHVIHVISISFVYNLSNPWKSY